MGGHKLRQVCCDLNSPTAHSGQTLVKVANSKQGLQYSQICDSMYRLTLLNPRKQTPKLSYIGTP